MKNTAPRGRRGMPLLLFFLLVTLGLSLWLGFQAVTAAQSHRRTAEGALRDYSEIAAATYSRRVQSRADRFFRELFGNVPWTIRRGPPPPPEVLERRFEGALEKVNCECNSLQSQASFLVLDMATGVVASRPEGVPFGEKTRAAGMARAAWEETPAERIAMTVVGEGQGLQTPAALFFNASLDESREEGAGRAIYVLHAPLKGASELFESWYYESGLLPEAVAGDQPNDSLLHLAVYSPDGIPVFQSPLSDRDVALSTDTLPERLGGLIIEVGVRPDAASALVIGGLPRERIPFLLALMFLTLGVGFAAFMQIRKEQELARVRDDFISGVSHEFRTPLTQIRMFTELLADGKLQTDEERVRSTEVIDREARRLTHLVENILHFSLMGRATGGRASTETILVSEAVGDLTEAFAPLVEAKDSDLEVFLDPVDLKVSASRSGLHRMLANLVDNAVKYGPRGQTIRIGAIRREGWIRISVEDEGPGIPEGERNRIWDPYHRLDRDVEGQVRGSGIGLSVVAELARAAGGAAWVEEGKKGGARFWIRLPAPDEATMPQAGPDKALARN